MVTDQSLLRRRRLSDKLFKAACFAAAIIAVLFLVFLLVAILRDGLGRISPDFFSNIGSRFPDKAGLKVALAGTIWVIGLTALIAVPLGLAASVYLEEFAPPDHWATRLIQLNISNLAGVPSIVYGLLGLGVFVRFFALDRSVIAGALTMSLLILPTIIVVAQEAIRAVPSAYREGSLALGATRWQTVFRATLPNAMPGIITGIILSVSRAIGETAPLITIGAVAFIASPPDSLGSKFTVIPIQIFDWASRPQKGFHEAAAAAITVLMGVLVVMNSLAVILRARSQRRN
ncbi:MAG: phosphate ABC transporter permease PstA [Fimbriimonadaceae bacterium]|nr:phosphate ABC transporter permease PstA [Fimbriimonadaceae bacterium]QYK55776.1 MAG: phosphate ABC transporter permease PstA [Fimbriimonadaceae bacterium]